jgi:hypothetical protein
MFAPDWVSRYCLARRVDVVQINEFPHSKRIFNIDKRNHLI